MLGIALNYITWDVNPEIISDPIPVRYYGLCFVMGFILGYPVVKKIFVREGVKEELLDKLLLYSMIATIVGARLGHVLFYGPYHTADGTGYFDDPISILKVNEGGLASHGGVIGLIIAMILYSRYASKKHVLWGLDRLSIGGALAAGFIRIGNLFNSEIAGKITDSSLGWYFPRYVSPEGSQYQGVSDADLALKFAHESGINPADAHVLRYPTQIYESLAYLTIFGILLLLYWKRDAGRYLGRITGWFLVMLFTVRVLVEFIKENQDAMDANSVLNKGQLLSLPFIAIGLVLIWYSYRKDSKLVFEAEMPPGEKPESAAEFSQKDTGKSKK